MAASRCRPSAGSELQQSDAVPLEAAVWSDVDQRTEGTQGPAGRERSLEADRGRSRPEHSGSESIPSRVSYRQLYHEPKMPANER